MSTSICSNLFRSCKLIKRAIGSVNRTFNGKTPAEYSAARAAARKLQDHIPVRFADERPRFMKAAMRSGLRHEEAKAAFDKFLRVARETVAGALRLPSIHKRHTDGELTRRLEGVVGEWERWHVVHEFNTPEARALLINAYEAYSEFYDIIALITPEQEAAAELTSCGPSDSQPAEQEAAPPLPAEEPLNEVEVPTANASQPAEQVTASALPAQAVIDENDVPRRIALQLTHQWTEPTRPDTFALAPRELTRYLGLPQEAYQKVDAFLRRLNAKHPEIRTESKNPRKGEPHYMYRVNWVWPPLLEQLPNWRRHCVVLPAS